MKKTLLKLLWELLKDIFKVFVGGIGAMLFMEGVTTQDYFLCGACIVLFFALFWAMLTERLNVELEREKRKHGK
jgi:predicted tellurium resistance membrane protein TerC